MVRQMSICRVILEAGAIPLLRGACPSNAFQPRSGESLPAPGFSRGTLNLRRSISPVGAKAARYWDQTAFVPTALWVRAVFEIPRLKPGAGKLSPLRG